MALKQFSSRFINSKEEYGINNTKNLGSNLITFPTVSQFWSLNLTFLNMRQKGGMAQV